MKISDLIRELQEIQEQHGDLPVNISMNGYENGDNIIVQEKENEFDFFVDRTAKALLLEGNSRDLEANFEDHF